MLDVKELKASDLVLKVSENIDPARFDITKYEAFLDALCESREFQKDAIRIVLRYFLSGRYKNLRNLAEENYKHNDKLKELYSSFRDFEKHLQLPDKLSCTIDLATATGKSYVIYGIARIMLAEGVVDKVLTLVPSTTIEKGLKEKFEQLSAGSDLLRLIPESAKIRNPRITSATRQIKPGDICVENIHAVYEHVTSSIQDSLIGKGENTLVICDEVHHTYNPPIRDKAIKKWKEFLLDDKYNFKYIIGDTGTAYIGNDYFTDVVYRYSLRQAIEEKFAKTIRYVAEDSPGGEQEKFQKIYDNHLENKMRYRKVKPITIIITKDIAYCKKLTEKWLDFVAKKEHISKKEAEKKILIVTSSAEHKANVLKLDKVDDNDDPTEWITSVSMLTEGWDVKNVFQIVPHEEKAFNSKLLIAQVLGRGLRIPLQYRGEQPIVTVFNHDNWARSIKHLVDEVMEIETRLHTYPVKKEKDYNFDIHNIKYERKPNFEEIPKETPYELLKKGYISYSNQVESTGKETTYERAITEVREKKSTYITYDMVSIDDVVQKTWNMLKVYDNDEGTSYAKDFPKSRIKEIIKNSLKKINWHKDTLSEENALKTQQAFGIVKRKKAKVPRFELEVKDMFKINTSSIKKTSVGVGAFRSQRGETSIFYDEDTLNLSDDEDIKALQDLIAIADDLRGRALRRNENKFLFRTCLNCVIAHSKPERKFIEKLISNANLIDAWIKSRDTGFYSIEYSWDKGTHPKQNNFNPDFFLKMGNKIVVIETKDDDLIRRVKDGGDEAKELKAQYRYAKEHFDRINKLQKDIEYYFTFLTERDFDNFFATLKQSTFTGFKSLLDVELED